MMVVTVAAESHSSPCTARGRHVPSTASLFRFGVILAAIMFVGPIAVHHTHAAVVRESGVDELPEFTEACLGCICDATSACNLTIGCTAGLCGPFLIGRQYWFDAGAPVLTGDSWQRKGAYEACTVDPYCSTSTMYNYMSRYIQASSEYGSGSKSIVSIDDYPYIIYDTNDSWQDVVTKLKNTKDDQIIKIFGKYKGLCQNTDMSSILRRMIIQHCFSHIFMHNDNFESEETVQMRTSLKLEMETSMARIKSAGSNSEDESLASKNQCIIIESIKCLLKSRSIKDNEISEILNNLQYAIHNYAMEFIFLSLSGSRVANFLMELFDVMDKGRPNDPHFFIKSIVTMNQSPSLHLKGEANTVTGHEMNLMNYFRNIHSTVEDYLDTFTRNRQQIVFQNRLIRNHCIQKHMIDGLSQQSQNVLHKLHQLKLKDFESRSKIFLNDVFKDETIQYSGCEDLMSLADLRRDLTFSELRSTNDYIKLKGEEIDTLDKLLSMWIEEKILMSAINQRMYLVLLKIFYHIDDNSVNPKEDVEAILKINLKK